LESGDSGMSEVVNEQTAATDQAFLMHRQVMFAFEVGEELGDGGSSAAGDSVSYSLWCRCPSSPFSFFGPVCSFAVLSCPSCVSPFIGGATLRLYGIGLDSLFRISVAQRTAEFTSATFVNASSADGEQKDMWNKFGQTYPNLQVLTLFTPALVQRNSAAAADEQSTSRRMPTLSASLFFVCALT
jgi:hypothetical protein